MGSQMPILNSAQLLKLGRPNLTYSFDEGERIHCSQVYLPNRFKLQIHFEHLPNMHECGNLDNIRCQSSLIGSDGLAVALGVRDFNGTHYVHAFRERDFDARDMSLHSVEPIVNYWFPEFKEVKKLMGPYKVRFEVIWIQKKGILKDRKVIHTVDTPVIDLWYEEKVDKKA